MPRMAFTAAEATFVADAARAMALDINESQLQQLGAFLDQLVVWTGRYRLVGTRDRRTLIRKHVVDSLAISQFIPENQLVMDIGSGAGFPAVPLAIVRPTLRVIALESRRRPTNFLREIRRQLALSNLEVLERRVEELGDEGGLNGMVDVTVARAWASLEKLLAVSSRLLRRGGMVISMRARKARAEVEALACPGEYSDPRLVDYRLAGGNEVRTLVVCRRH
jgi:16S rRNA (guanine527-N7)-methyltransferase